MVAPSHFSGKLRPAGADLPGADHLRGALLSAALGYWRIGESEVDIDGWMTLNRHLQPGKGGSSPEDKRKETILTAIVIALLMVGLLIVRWMVE